MCALQKLNHLIFIPYIWAMIDFESFFLDNGLEVHVHEDHTSPIAVVNVLYKVGSRDEEEDKTGFAHLFEHLMFGGSAHIPNYDEPLQRVGGNNNAFTSADITNYYVTLPADNIETAFWLESDRMLGLSFDPKALEVQQKVVIEEFKQQYLNQPYGDAWLKMRPLAYQKHPYRWPTIGKDIDHIEQATMDDVKAFFHQFYHPNNAVLVVAGDVSLEQVKQLSQKWFGPIPAGEKYVRNLPKEPVQQAMRTLLCEAEVPADALYMAFHMPGRADGQYHSADLMGDILGRGKSSRLYDRLVEKKKLFNNIDAYVTGSLDPGLLVISGKIAKGESITAAEQGVWEVVHDFQRETISPTELQKVKNKAESSLVFSEVDLLNRAMNLAFAAVMGDPGLVNREAGLIRQVSMDDVVSQAQGILSEKNASVLRYQMRH